MPSVTTQSGTGEYRETCTITRRTITRDTHAAVTTAGTVWATLVSDWRFRIVEQSGGETVYAGKVVGSRRYVLEGCYVSGILKYDRMTWGSKTLDIEDVENADGVSMTMLIVAQEMAN